jgi:hypothetical protein
LSDRTVKKLLSILFVLLFLLPLALYAYKFGFGLWGDHKQWAAMGGFFSGIYSPVIALLALVILAGQHAGQMSINKHQFDQAYIQNARVDIDYYLEKLADVLNQKISSEQSVKDLLNGCFAYLTIEELRIKK